MTDGVTPNVEVKRADLAEVNAEGNERQGTPPPLAPATPGATPPAIVAPKAGDDLMLKKAVETLGAKMKKRTA
jgi:hypothetical protein